MLNDQQIVLIDKEIERLEDKKREVKIQNYSEDLKKSFEDYADGRIDALKWAKENL